MAKRNKKNVGEQKECEKGVERKRGGGGRKCLIVENFSVRLETAKGSKTRIKTIERLQEMFGRERKSARERERKESKGKTKK